MTHPSFAAHWKAIHDNRDWEMEERIARHMYSKPNDWISNPSGATTTAWHHYLSLRVWAHGRTSELASYCLEVANRQAQEAWKVNAFERQAIPGSFPRNRFDHLVAKAFIDGIVNRAPL